MFFLSGGNLFLEKNQLHGRVAGSMAGHGGAEDDISPEQCTVEQVMASEERQEQG